MKVPIIRMYNKKYTKRYSSGESDLVRAAVYNVYMASFIF